MSSSSSGSSSDVSCAALKAHGRDAVRHECPRTQELAEGRLAPVHALEQRRALCAGRSAAARDFRRPHVHQDVVAAVREPFGLLQTPRVVPRFSSQGLQGKALRQVESCTSTAFKSGSVMQAYPGVISWMTGICGVGATTAPEPLTCETHSQSSAIAVQAVLQSQGLALMPHLR